jgi:hypothetical protein
VDSTSLVHVCARGLLYHLSVSGQCNGIINELEIERIQSWYNWRMVSSGMLHRVALVRTDVSEEPSASFIGVTRIGELGTTLAATSNRHVVPSSPILVTRMKEALGSSETSVRTRATRRNILEDTILHSHRRENLKSYMAQLRSNIGECLDKPSKIRSGLVVSWLRFELSISRILDYCQRNLLSKIWGFHGSDYVEWRLLGCYAVWLL